MPDKIDRGQRKPSFKFRLLCKRCNSYLSTSLEPVYEGGGPKHGQICGAMLRCSHCDVVAHSLDETFTAKNAPPPAQSSTER